MRFVAVFVLLAICPAWGAPGIAFQRADIVSTNGSAADTEALRAAVEHSWDRWLHLDAAGYADTMSLDVTRFSERAPRAQQGRRQVLHDLAAEWSAFERPDGMIAESLRVRQARVHVDGDCATMQYWLDAQGGTRWHYDDRAFVFQAFIRDGRRWRIVHQSDFWSLDYNFERGRPGKETFSFEYVYPVVDLARAVRFYVPLLGPPEHVAADRAVFNLQGQRFVLARDATAVRDGRPNGHAIFLVDDLARERRRLEAAGTALRGGVMRRGGDSSAAALDADGNLLVLEQRSYLGKRASALRIEGLPAVLQAWMRTDAAAVAGHLAPDAQWLDDTRLRTRGVERAPRLGLDNYWRRYDRDAQGLLATASISGMRRRKIGLTSILSYQLKLRGTGPHPYDERANVTQVMDGRGRVSTMLIQADTARHGMVSELDYSGTPVVKMKRAERFYTSTMRLGDPYRDEDWRGWWSDRTVYGVYLAEPELDGLPVRGKANGYMSFWVPSVAKARDYVQKHGGRFPRIKAITMRAGITEEAGYKQLYATDSEGNGLVFSEYTGRRR